MTDLDLARRHAPIVYFDAAEPFVPELVGYEVRRQPGPSPSHGRYLDPRTPDGRRAEAVVEYALWTDWDIQHLYELEHAWSYLDAEGRLIYAEASWHGRHGPLVQAGRLSHEGARPVAYAQPGKHAMVPDPGVFTQFDILRLTFADEADRRAGSSGLITPPIIAGHLVTNRRRDALANGYLRTRHFRPTFRFDQRWDALGVPWLTCAELLARIPARVEAQLARLESERAQRRVWAICFDIGDTLMIEQTEEKDAEQTTQRAELWPGAAELIWGLRRAGYLLALVADTRPGTYKNVLRQHGLYEAFDVFSISEELGWVKPDPRMFEHALDGLGLAPAEAGHVLMVGNNLARDARGANALGIVSVWIHFNDRYPLIPADEHERPVHEVTSMSELAELIRRLG
jgi:HAD superfamily hydrolase (TIGR01549 family)